jgi:hypothetical protein
MKLLRWLMIALIGLSLAPTADARSVQPSIQEAQQLFRKFKQREAAFDPSLAALYSNYAKVYTLRRMKNGRVRPLSSSGREFKRNLRKTLALAKKRGDRNTYSRVRYLPEGRSVRIRAMRYNRMKQYSSPFTLLVGKDADGEWRIVEDISETRW